MNNIFRHIRLLPLVLVVGTSLLTVKSFGLLHEAQAESAGDAQPSEQGAAAMASPSDDPAADDADMASAAEVDVLTSLTKRRKQLDAREQQIAMRENVITAAAQRVDTRIAELKALETEIQTLLGQRDTEEQKQVASLVKTYSAMKAKDAARIFDTLDTDVRIAVAQQMKSDVLAPILAAMQSDQAQKLTIALANRLKVTPPAVAPVPPPAAPAPDGTQAAATTPATTPPASTPPTTAATTPPAPEAAPKTPPQQTAAATPPKPAAPKPHRAAPKPAPQKSAAATPPAPAPVQTAANTKPATTTPAAATPPPATPAATPPATSPATTTAANTKPVPAATAPATTPAPSTAKPGG